jgi:hypothetical protein
VGPGLRPLNLEDRFHDFGVEAKEYELDMALELWDLPAENSRTWQSLRFGV